MSASYCPDGCLIRTNDYLYYYSNDTYTEFARLIFDKELRPITSWMLKPFTKQSYMNDKYWKNECRNIFVYSSFQHKSYVKLADGYCRLNGSEFKLLYYYIIKRMVELTNPPNINKNRNNLAIYELKQDLRDIQFLISVIRSNLCLIMKEI